MKSARSACTKLVVAALAAVAAPVLATSATLLLSSTAAEAAAAKPKTIYGRCAAQHGTWNAKRKHWVIRGKAYQRYIDCTRKGASVKRSGSKPKASPAKAAPAPTPLGTPSPAPAATPSPAAPADTEKKLPN